MLKNINRYLEKWMPLLTPISLLIGILLSEVFRSYTFLVPWIFAMMTFSGSLGANFKDLSKAILKPWPLLVSLLILHVAVPLLAWETGIIVFGDDALTRTGLVLAFVIPTGIVSFMWVSIYRGNVALTLSIILVDTLLSPVIVPYSLSLLVGAEVEMDHWGIMKGLLWMIVLPSLLGMLCNQLTAGRVKQTLAPKLAPFSKLGLSAVVMINSSAVAPYLLSLDKKLLWTGITVLCVAFSGYVIGWLIAKLLNWEREIIVALTFNSGMRNISSGTVLAIAYFPAPVAVPVIIGTLFQQLLASLFAYLLRRFYGQGNQNELIKHAGS